MNRSDLEFVIERFYADRLKNDPDLCVQHFHASGRLELPGLESDEYLGHAELKGLFEAFVSNWHWENWTPLQTIIDGQTVAIRYRIYTVFMPTGARLTTQIVDHITVDHELKIVQYVEFLDTALFQRLMMQAATR